ncbi:hypothetical protein EX30DRAFT_23440 [Ascodesmis nigricans]|uniref:Extracellular membrane protein CFEM domain-containing protein n=1 Tax=Ascodesmis nigricans TaxID=341454 RepID=A0A4S2N7U0_9PEZI|nr:hypothetical protein EX30DRAFT_23440 [Ascodesmis nigricans]
MKFSLTALIAPLLLLPLATALSPRAPIPELEPRAAATCSKPQANTCTFYTKCLEPAFKCGKNGYPLNYGLKYCKKFSSAKKKFSPRGKAWVTKTMLCLQNKLVNDVKKPKIGCSKLRSKAFATHPECYVKSGLCVLPTSDWAKIVATVSIKELFGSVQALKATLDTVDGCMGFYKWLIKKGLIKVKNGVVSWAKGVWDTITGWF